MPVSLPLCAKHDDGGVDPAPEPVLERAPIIGAFARSVVVLPGFGPRLGVRRPVAVETVRLKRREPVQTAAGKRIPGLKLDNPRQLALMHALVRFCHIAAGNSFTTAELRPRAVDAVTSSADRYTLAALRSF